EETVGVGAQKDTVFEFWSGSSRAFQKLFIAQQGRIAGFFRAHSASMANFHDLHARMLEFFGDARDLFREKMVVYEIPAFPYGDIDDGWFFFRKVRHISFRLLIIF